MKFFMILSLMVSLNAWSRSAMDFNQVLNEDMMRDIRKDDEKFRKDSFRKPASVTAEVEPIIEDTPKLDKNVRQIGPNKW